MPKKGEAYTCAPKRFCVPPDISVLQNYAGHLANSMRATYQHRMTEGAKAIGSGKGKQSKRGKPGRKKG